jgi:hypothetical protein
MHEALGGAFSKRHHVDCGMIAIICKVLVLGRHTTRANFQEKMRLYVTDTKIAKYPNDTIMIELLLFKQIQISIFSFLYAIYSHFVLKYCMSMYQGNIHMGGLFQKKLKLSNIIFFI